METSIPVLTVFFQGLLSFFSPCVLPLVPLYVGYLAGGAKSVDNDGTIRYPRKRVLVNTLFFVLGVSFAFFLLGLGVTALGSFFSDNKLILARISGIIMIFFGLYQFGVFGRSKKLSEERRFFLNLDKWTMGPIPALLLGFTFSFAWTPCVGPTLGGVLLMAGSSGKAAAGFLLIGVYTLGFILPFLAVGLFTGSVLNFFKKYQNIVKYTVKIGAALLILMGVMTLTGALNGVTGYLSKLSTQQTAPAENKNAKKQEKKEKKEEQDASKNPPAYDFTLKDQYGKEHRLSDYKGKTVFLNFWATWCPPCKAEMPEIQNLYEKYGKNGEDLIVLGLASPNYGNEGSEEDIKAFLEKNQYSFPVVMDTKGKISASYGIQAFPTTFMIDKEGNVYGYVNGAITEDIMENIVKQTMEGKRGEE